MTEHSVSYRSFKDQSRPDLEWWKCTCGLSSSAMPSEEAHAKGQAHLKRHDDPPVQVTITLTDIDPVQADRHLRQRIAPLLRGWPGHVKVEGVTL